MYFRKIQSRILRKYIICNICLVVTPVIILALLYFIYARNQIILQIEETQTFALEQVMQSANANIADFGMVAVQVSSDVELTPYNLNSSNFSAMNAIRRLRAYHAQTGFLNEMFLYLKGGEKIFTSEGVISIENYTQFRYTFDKKWTAADFYETLQNSDEYAAASYRHILHDRSGSYVLLLKPWPATSGNPFGCIGGLVKISYFQNLLNGIDGSIDSDSFITDEYGTLLFSSEKGIQLEPEQLRQMLTEFEESGLQKVKIRGDTNSMIVLDSSENDWRYITIFPHEQFTSRLLRLQLPYMTILSLLLLFSIAFGIWISYSNYQPIYELRRLLGSTGKRRGSENGELQELNRTILMILDKNQTLMEQLIDSKRIVAQKLLSYIVKNDSVLADNSFREQLKTEGIYLDGPYYCMVAIYIPKNTTPDEMDDFTQAIRLASNNTAYALDMIYRDMTAVLCNLKSPVHGARSMVASLLETVDCLFNVTPQIGVGHSYKDMHMLGRSLSEAVAVVDSAGAEQQDEMRVIYFDELKMRKSTDLQGFTSPAVSRLIQGLKQGSKLVIETSLNEIRQEMTAQMANNDIVGIRYMSDCIIQRLLPLISESEIEVDGSIIERMTKFTVINDFFIYFQEVCEKISKGFNNKKQEERKELFGKVENYVQEHSCDQSMSLNLLASQFGMSAPGMSRFFREKADQNFIDYLTQIRMKRACALLRDTDLLVRDIMEQIGYADISSFTRKFTMITGTSPGKYRAQIRKEKRIDG